MHSGLAQCSAVFFLLLSWVHYAGTSAFAQAGQAELTGTVADEAHAGVSGAIVTVTEFQTNDTMTVTTGGDGVYTVINLRPGLYTVAVEAANFRRFRREGVTLGVGERIRVDVRLTIGTVNEVVTVTFAHRDRQSRTSHPESLHR
ncbi:MAG: carboxypeptidase regulatory-like domain-containing protein [Pyrinomonadaceae bacterium]|nr:carboxypeptidase regulatory-like domain-containing protein [Pyrinomonadaceae bacterium]